MKLIVSTLALGAGLATVPVSYAEITINENRYEDAIDCQGQDVVINGNRAKLTLTGDCNALHVNGNRNVVEVDEIGAIQVLGNKNRVVWVKGIGTAKPRISNLGSKNVVKRGAVALSQKTPSTDETNTTATVSESSPTAPTKSVTIAGGLGNLLSITKQGEAKKSVTIGGVQIKKSNGKAKIATSTTTSTESYTQAPPIVVNTNENRKTYDCKGAEVQINGNDNLLTFLGDCHGITVNGNDNRLNVEATDVIRTMGNGNEVQWVAGVSGSQPTITNLGNSNQVYRHYP